MAAAGETREVTVKGVGGAGAGVVVRVPGSATATVADLKKAVAEQGGGSYDAAALTLVCHGAVLGSDAALLSSTELFGAAKSTIIAVSKKRKQEGAHADPAPAAPGGAAAKDGAAAAAGGAGGGKRVVVLVRHGQCANEGGTDEEKHLTRLGHRQAQATAEHIGAVFDAGLLPKRRLMVHSTSRRARETAQKLRDRLGAGLISLGNDLLRECDPVTNPWRAEEAFTRLFCKAEGAEDEALLVVAHNNTNLYLLMRAAGLPPDLAREAWRLFLLRHASVTVVTVLTGGGREITSIGEAGHFNHDLVTWHNVHGPDEGVVERHKFSGRALVLIRAGQHDHASRAGGEHSLTRVGRRQAKATAEYVRGLTDYCVSKRATMMCSDAAAAMQTAAEAQEALGLTVIPDPAFAECATEEDRKRAEGSFLRLFQAPEGGHHRDTVVVVAHNNILVYWILRALRYSPEQAQAAWAHFRLRQGSVTLLTMSREGVGSVRAFGDSGHLRSADITTDDLPGADDAAEPPPPVENVADLEQLKRAAFERKDFAACKAIQARIAAAKAAQ